MQRSAFERKLRVCACTDTPPKEIKAEERVNTNVKLSDLTSAPIPPVISKIPLIKAFASTISTLQSREIIKERKVSIFISERTETSTEKKTIYAEIERIAWVEEKIASVKAKENLGILVWTRFTSEHSCDIGLKTRKHTPTKRAERK